MNGMELLNCYLMVRLLVKLCQSPSVTAYISQTQRLISLGIQMNHCNSKNYATDAVSSDVDD